MLILILLLTFGGIYAGSSLKMEMMAHLMGIRCKEVLTTIK